jgi:hypothetical protein
MIMDAETMLSRREATLRAAATTCLGAIALLQAIGLPAAFAQGKQFGALSITAMALCVCLGWALAAAPADAARPLWGLVAGVSVLVLAGWAAPRAFAVPGLDHAGAHWTAMPGAACGALAAVCLLVAGVAARPTPRAARGLATAVVVLLAMGPGVGVLLVALGPGAVGGEAALAAGAHVHAASFESSIKLRPGSGRDGGHFVVPVAATPHQTPLGIALVVAPALVFMYGAVGYLRRRSAAPVPVAVRGIERGLP